MNDRDRNFAILVLAIVVSILIVGYLNLDDRVAHLQRTQPTTCTLP